MIRRLSTLAALLVAAGCTRPCKPGTILVQLTFDARAAQSDKLLVSVTTGGKKLVAPAAAHPPGATSGTLEIDLPSYVAGQKVAITVEATRSNIIVGSGGVESLALANGCTTTPLDVTAAAPPDMSLPPPASPDLGGYGAPLMLSTTATNKLDILFMVDNSPSMDAMQTQLQTQFAKFLQPFVDLASVGYYADLHIGVITSDYGAGDVANPASGCGQSPGGQKGVLQATAASGTSAAGCKGPVGTPFITYTFGPSGDTSNLSGGSTPANLSSTFVCMASVGSFGCGFEHQLESTYAALNNTFENAGFLRDDALLGVVMFTNEDDGSAPPATDIFNPDSMKTGAPPNGYGAYDTYRQTRFGVECQINNVPTLSPYADSMGALMGCAPAPNNNSVMLGSEYDVSRYIDLFTKPKSQGGVKADPASVVLVAIDAPDVVDTSKGERPFEIRAVAPNTGLGKPPAPAYTHCDVDAGSGQIDGRTCFARLEHSCQNTVQPAFFGDPAVRLNTVVRAAQYNQVFSICGDDLSAAPDYTNALTATGSLLRAHMLGNCLPTKLANPAAPQCFVVEHQANPDGGADVTLPSCATSAAPCWSVVSNPSCSSVSPDSVSISLSLTSPLPAGATVTASCQTN